MRVTAKVDYAVRAAVVLAHAAENGTEPVKGDRIREVQSIPLKFCENILGELRQEGIVRSQRGAEGGYWLARKADMITIADIIRAVEGPLANVRGERPENIDYPDGSGALQEVWIATRAALRSVLERVTVADVAHGELPKDVKRLLEAPDAWEPHEIHEELLHPRHELDGRELVVPEPRGGVGALVDLVTELAAGDVDLVDHPDRVVRDGRAIALELGVLGPDVEELRDLPREPRLLGELAQDAVDRRFAEVDATAR